MKRMLLPSDTTVSAVQKWLVDGGVKSVDVDADWINIRTTVGVANELLSTKFAWYTSEKLGKRLRTLEYSVPDEIVSHVNTIQPTVRFGQGTPQHETHHAIDNSNLMDLAGAAETPADCVRMPSMSHTKVLMHFRTNTLLPSACKTCTKSTTRPTPKAVAKLLSTATWRSLPAIPTWICS